MSINKLIEFFCSAFEGEDETEKQQEEKQQEENRRKEAKETEEQKRSELSELYTKWLIGYLSKDKNNRITHFRGREINDNEFRIPLYDISFIPEAYGSQASSYLVKENQKIRYAGIGHNQFYLLSNFEAISCDIPVYADNIVKVVTACPWVKDSLALILFNQYEDTILKLVNDDYIFADDDYVELLKNPFKEDTEKIIAYITKDNDFLKKRLEKKREKDSLKKELEKKRKKEERDSRLPKRHGTRSDDYHHEQSFARYLERSKFALQKDKAELYFKLLEEVETSIRASREEMGSEQSGLAN